MPLDQEGRYDTSSNDTVYVDDWESSISSDSRKYPVPYSSFFIFLMVVLFVCFSVFDCIPVEFVPGQKRPAPALDGESDEDVPSKRMRQDPPPSPLPEPVHEPVSSPDSPQDSPQ